MTNFLGRVLYYIGLPSFILYLRFRHSARVIVEQNGTFLAVKPWLGSGVWLLPGGGKKRGEAAARAAVRELAEETSITLDPEALIPLGKYRCQHGHHLVSHDEVFWYVSPGTVTVKLRGLENVDASWQPYTALRAVCGSPALLKALERERAKAGLV